MAAIPSPARLLSLCGGSEGEVMKWQSKSILASLFLSVLFLSGCGADGFLRTSARVHSYTKAARQLLENIYDDKLASRETVLDVARPLQRFQAKQVEVF